ncbi:hypothetical protein ElyMa_006299000 [Elysia marginata]|uniref:TIR domain-containing protein n=1 Tax=Elysia marginata TaxID=1093978 RepID=A0AAV4HHD1_9GAST|nr:hypothetical protein ElyMa_006299000 [Elysia marginata]
MIYITQGTGMECLHVCSETLCECNINVLDRNGVARQGGSRSGRIISELCQSALVIVLSSPLYFVCGPAELALSPMSPRQAIGPRQVSMRCTQCLES